MERGRKRKWNGTGRYIELKNQKGKNEKRHKQKSGKGQKGRVDRDTKEKWKLTGRKG